MAAVPLLLLDKDVDYTVGYGFLHVNKSLVRSIRNYQILHETGIHSILLLYSLYNGDSDMTDTIRRVVSTKSIIGRDKHSDQDNYSVVSEKVGSSFLNVKSAKN